MSEPTQWRKTPKFQLRWACLDDVSRDWKPGFFVESGAGTGTLSRGFLDRGFHGVVQDISEDTRAVLRDNLASYGDQVRVLASLDEMEPETADYLFSFEVIEHIPDDAAALAEWTKVLKPGGRLLVSTPAHQHRYGSADALVGHVRRYSKQQLTELLQGAGYEQIRIYSVGYPLGNITRVLQTWYDRLLRRGEVETSGPSEALSIDSGVRTDRSVNAVSRILNERTMRPFFALQRRYYDTERGDGWVATAVKS
jgi:SAM-dependent methyltransferase